MKKALFVLTSILFVVCVTAQSVFSQEARKMTEQELAALDSEYFVSMDRMDTSSNAKFSEALIREDGNDPDAKCWFRGYRGYYPSYYYYSWYCPVYVVPLRLVVYTVPVTVISTTTIFFKSSGRTATGAVIDKQVPSNSPLLKMGLRSGDIITSVDGNPVHSLLDVRRIKSTSNVTYVRGNKIKVAGKPLLQRVTDSSAKNYEGLDQKAIDLGAIKSLQKSEMSLYDYYDQQEKAASKVPAKEYGSDQY